MNRSLIFLFLKSENFLKQYAYAKLALLTKQICSRPFNEKEGARMIASHL